MTRSKEKTIREMRSIRDTVESVWVAVVLAFVLRAFMVEAFVIPTGSMAPRLMGEHWQLVCPTCGYDYAYGVPRHVQNSPKFNRARQQTPSGAVCPNCGSQFPATLDPDYPRGGDRVLVMKYLYRLTDPQPWDVVVFRNPQNNRENYIKRLIGVPGETIEILHGDVFVRQGEGSWQVRTKPPRAQREMWQVIFDNDYRPNMEIFGRYDRIGAKPPEWLTRDGGWDLSGQDGRRFTFLGEGRAEIFLSATREAFLPQYGYNLPKAEARGIDYNRDVGSDLKLSLVLVPRADDSTIELLLTSFDHKFTARLSADGTCLLLHETPDQVGDNWRRQARIEPLQIGKSYQVALTHADFRATLWVDGRAVLTTDDRQYPGDQNDLRGWLKARLAEADTRPIPVPRVVIAADGGQCELWHVKLYRDVYYTSPYRQPVDIGPLGDFARRLAREGKFVDRGRGWGTTDSPIALRKFDRDRRQFDQFFVLGDNSPQSLDGRGWTSASPTLRLFDSDGGDLYQLGTVPRYNLIGKAFFVYWPAGFRVPGLPGLPILPNVGRMRLIR